MTERTVRVTPLTERGTGCVFCVGKDPEPEATYRVESIITLGPIKSVMGIGVCDSCAQEAIKRGATPPGD